jgi:hypothetical protein
MDAPGMKSDTIPTIRASIGGEREAKGGETRAAARTET